jgi:ubiquinone/menaquinone biosynthesis C-methylase UbiE
MPALLKTRSSDMGVGAAPIPSVAVAPSPAQNHAIPGAATSPSASLRCPRCRHSLVPLWEGELQCTRRARPHSYPIVAGIPDLRATLDADITVARERADARVLAEMLARVPQDGDGLSDDVSLLAREAFAEETKIGGASTFSSSEEVLSDWQELDRYESDARMVLDVGCRSGALLEAAARRWPVCVGVDGSLRRLVLAKHRLKQAGVKARLVCANTDALPFSDGIFDRVIAEWVLELAPRKERALREWNRMLSEQGRLWISTSNRWSVTRDPQLGIPALSWLPMQLVDLWAKWHGLTFPQRALVGTKRLRRLLEETGFSRLKVGKPVASESNETTSTNRSAMTLGRKSLYDLALVREIAKQVRPMLLATAGALPRVRGRVRYDRYIARQAL